MATARPRAALPAHHSGILAGTGGAVVVLEGDAILIDLTVEQTTPHRQVKHFPLAEALGTALSGLSVAQVGRA